MCALPHNDTLQPGVFSGIVQTPASRTPAPSRNLSTSKRVCFYKSGDPQFSGHRIVINSRTFKTFDALLDALSKKVPLPFGVRTITTPKGTHAVQSLDDLQDGASYVCSDQRRVKPLNLEKVTRRQVPWNNTRPTSSGRRGLIRQLVKKTEGTAKALENTVAVWTPKRLVVFKNRDPNSKHTVVLHRKTAPTFKAMLDFLSQVLQFPVVKLYTADGRRVEGLPALILCSGIVVAAGNEPFRLGNYNLQGSSQHSPSAISEYIGPAEIQPLPHKKISTGSRSRSRNFSSSSERYFVNQINKSLNGSLSEDNSQKTGSMDTENNQPIEMETSDCIADTEDKDHFIMPSEDDIEKSFRVNQDGSMTVEMKVRLTIKQEEMLHWTTTLSRTCTNSQQRAVCSQPGYTPDNSYNPVGEAKRDSSESKEDNTAAEKSVRLHKENEKHCGSTSSEALDKPKPALRRLPTPGPRRVKRKEASVENITKVSQNKVQESTVGSYSYMERTAEGELTEGYCLISRSSSSSTRPVPKPRRSSLGEAKPKKTASSLRSSRMAEVLQLQNNGTEITETVMHIYESQGTYGKYFPNTQVPGDKRCEFRAKTKIPRKPDSTDSGPRSSSNDCDVDLTRQSTSSGSQNVRKNELLSLSSGQSSPSQQISNNLSYRTNTEKHDRPESSHKAMKDLEARIENSDDKCIDNRKTNVIPKSKKSLKSKEGSSSDTTTADRKQKDRDSLKGSSKMNSPESQSHMGSEIKAASSAESNKQKGKKKKKDKWGSFQKSKLPDVNCGDQKESSEKELNVVSATERIKTRDGDPPRDSCQNVNAGQTNTLRAPIKKKLLDVLPPTQFKMLAKQRSMNECKTKSKESRELSESISMPVLPSSPANVHHYVESWLKKIQPDSVPYMDEMDPHETETEARAGFWLGGGSGDSSEIKSEPENGGLVKECTSLEDTSAERPVSRPPVQIRCEGESVETQRIRGFCKSMPSVRIHPAEHENRMRMNKSSEALVPIQTDAEDEASQSTKVSTKSGMKPVLQQLCLSIQSIRRTSSHSQLTSLEKEKSSSLPNFSSQVASVFGSPSKALLSFLSVMTLRDGISRTSDEDPVSDTGSYSEALQVMQSLEKIANIEDEEELKASLTSLQSSTSSQLKKSWSDFQERNDTEGSPPLSPKQSEQEFALEVDSEGGEQDIENCFGIKELMDELNMSEDLRREISSLVDGKLTNSNKGKLKNKHSIHSNETNDVGSENENATTKDDFLEDEVGYSEKRESQDDNSAESCPLEPARLGKDPVLEKSEENDQIIDNVTDQMDLVRYVPDMGGNARTTEEMHTDNVSCQVNKLEVLDNTQTNLKGKSTEGESVACMQLKSQSRKAEVHTHTSETDRTGLLEQNCELKDDSDTENANEMKIDRDEPNINTEEEDLSQQTAEYTEQQQDEHDIFNNHEQYEFDENQEAGKQNNVFIQEDNFGKDAKSHSKEPGTVNCDFESQSSHDSEARDKSLALESPGNEHGHISIREQAENTNELEDTGSEVLDCSADAADTEANGNGQVEEHEDINSEVTVPILSYYEKPDEESHHSSMPDEEGERPNRHKTGSCGFQKSESECQLQAVDKMDISETQISSAEERDEEAAEPEDEQSDALDSDKDFDAELEPNSPDVSDQDGEHNYQKESGSCKSLQSEGKNEFQILKEKNVSEKQMGSTGEKDEESDEQKDKQTNTSDSDEDFDAEQNYHAVPSKDGEYSEEEAQSCRSQESENENELQTTKEVKVTEENDKEDDEHECEKKNLFNFNQDFDAESDHLEVSDQDQHSDQNESGSCKSQESGGEQEFQTIEKESVNYKQFSSAGEEDEKEEDEEHDDRQSNILDSDKDFDVQPNCAEVSDQDFDNSDQDNALSSRSKESEAESELQMLEEQFVMDEKLGEVDECEDIQSSALDSEKDTNAETNLSDRNDDLSDHDEIQFCKSQESEAEYEPHTKEQVNIAKQISSAEELYDEADEDVGIQSDSLNSYKDIDAQSNHSDHSELDTKENSCSDQDTETHILQSEDTEGLVEAYHSCLYAQPMEISQELLDFVNSALLSSALTFTYDSCGHLRIEPDRCKIREMSLDESCVSSQCAQRRLPSPNTSDLSDYRPETSDSVGDLSQVSTDLLTENVEEDVERLSSDQGIVRQRCKDLKRHESLEKGLMGFKVGTKHTASPSLQSFNSHASLHDRMANGTIQESAYSNTSGSFNEDSEAVQRVAFHSKIDCSEGVLIDKGRWLLKENHLIRKSPPVPLGMYENADTTSADTGLDYMSEDAPYSPCVNHQSPLAAISSSELEEMAKPPTPKCTYFSMPHSSDSDPFLDNQSINSSKTGSNVRKGRELKVSPIDEPSKTWAKKNGSLPSFASVEFKLPDGRVHPEADLASGAGEKTARSQSISSRAAQEEDSVEGLNLRCGRHCPIL